MQGKRWCFTLNNPAAGAAQIWANLGAHDSVAYLTYGREIAPTTGTPHHQGFILFKSNKRFGAVRRLCPDGTHIELARGSTEQCILYCQKDGDFEEFGERPTNQQGRRSDIERFVEWLDSFEAENGRAPTSPEIAREQPIAYLRYPRATRLANRRAKRVDLFGAGEVELRPWQAELAEELNGDPDDRKIRFIVDEEGANGKTWFQQWYFSKNDDVQILGVGKRDDVAHAVLVSTRVFFFAVPRGGMEYFQYSVVEMLKDRIIFSPKYASETKLLHRVPHVVVFCNEEPDYTKLTEDRFAVTRL